MRPCCCIDCCIYAIYYNKNMSNYLFLSSNSGLLLCTEAAIKSEVLLTGKQVLTKANIEEVSVHL